MSFALVWRVIAIIIMAIFATGGLMVFIDQILNINFVHAIVIGIGAKIVTIKLTGEHIKDVIKKHRRGNEKK